MTNTKKAPVYTLRPLKVSDMRAIQKCDPDERNLLIAERRILKDGQPLTREEFDDLDMDVLEKLSAGADAEAEAEAKKT